MNTSRLLVGTAWLASLSAAYFIGSSGGSAPTQTAALPAPGIAAGASPKISPHAESSSDDPRDEARGGRQNIPAIIARARLEMGSGMGGMMNIRGMLRAIAQVLRQNGDELAMIDAADCGNPYSEMLRDANMGAAQLDFYAGLVTEMKGASIPMGPDVVNFSVREPYGVVGRIIPFNHPFMFAAGKSGAPLAAGNTVVLKPPEQAPLSALRLAELIDGILPPGVWNLVPGGKEVGQVLASHPDIAKVALIGSVPTGRAVMRAAAETLKPVTLSRDLGREVEIATDTRVRVARGMISEVRQKGETVKDGA